MPPLLTICVPNYNSERYVALALESILKQTYMDFNLVVMDNCSTDRSLEIIRGFKDPRLRILTHGQHVSITENFNLCIQQCDTNYLCLMHADDRYEPDYLEIMVSAMDRYPDAGIGHCDFKIMDEQNQIIDHFRSNLKRQAFPSNTQTFSIRPPMEELSQLLRVPYIICPAVIYRKSVLEKVGVFDTRYKQVHDWDLFVRILINQIPFLFVNKKLFINRVHNSTTNQHRKSLVKYKEQLSFYRNVFHLLNQKQLNIDWTLTQAYKKVLQIILWDIKEDLLHGQRQDAKRKLEFIREEEPLLNNRALSYSLLPMIGLGPTGGFLLDKLAKTYLSLRRIS